MAPVCSPTEIICTTMPGKTFEPCSGSAIVLPSAIDDFVIRISFSTTTLPAVRATISSASRIGTPDESMVERVREKRATAGRAVPALQRIAGGEHADDQVDDVRLQPVRGLPAKLTRLPHTGA